MSRPPRPAFPGATYHITARGNNGERIFGDDADRYAYLVQLAKALRTMDVRLFAYALMSNHVHLALQTTQPNVSAMVRWLHTRHARQFNRRHGRINHLFGERFHSKVITDDLYLLELEIFSQDLRRSRKAYARFIRDELTRLTVTARIVPASQN
ncbi:MAG: transposase [Armatimonadetes bacterium]|nr:transposase [Armatimonadota bacterium]